MTRPPVSHLQTEDAGKAEAQRAVERDVLQNQEATSGLPEVCQGLLGWTQAILPVSLNCQGCSLLSDVGGLQTLS